MCKDVTLAQTLARAALDEVERLLTTNQTITFQQVKEYFHA